MILLQIQWAWSYRQTVFTFSKCFYFALNTHLMLLHDISISRTVCENSMAMFLINNKWQVFILKYWLNVANRENSIQFISSKPAGLEERWRCGIEAYSLISLTKQTTECFMQQCLSQAFTHVNVLVNHLFDSSLLTYSVAAVPFEGSGSDIRPTGERRETCGRCCSESVCSCAGCKWIQFSSERGLRVTSS